MTTFALTYKNEDGSERFDFYYGSEFDTVESVTEQYATVIRLAKEGKPHFASMKTVKEVIVEQA